MKGIELAQQYYLTYGKPLLDNEFSDIAGKVAVGLFGSGSQCYGYDDELSEDHDYQPGFIILLPDEETVDSRRQFQLERAYRQLPDEFMGYRKSLIAPADPYRYGVFRLSDWFMEKLGTPDGCLTIEQWLTTEDFRLLEATNGKVFRDDSGMLTEVRNRIASMPETILLKKLAANLMTMNQAGQYNYPRCCNRNESAAGQLALYEYVKAAQKVIFLLNHQYMPYYKWSFRALRELPRLSLSAVILEYLISNPNGEAEQKVKLEMMKSLEEIICDELIRQKIINEPDADFSHLALSVNSLISNPTVRNLDILAAL